MSSRVLMTLKNGETVYVSPEDAPRLSMTQWRVQQAGKRSYAAVKSEGKVRLMHRVIMKAPQGMLVDHRDQDTFNNTRQNLRICTQSQNQANRGKNATHNKYKGVHWHKAAGKWNAEIKHNYKTHRLGLFTNEHDAAIAYNKKALELFGEFALLNEVPY